MICCAAEKEFKLIPVQGFDARWELHSFQWLLISSKQQAESAVRWLWPIILGIGVNQRQGMNGLKTLEIGESPGFLLTGGQSQTLEGFTSSLLHRCQHTAHHDQATPSAASC